MLPAFYDARPCRVLNWSHSAALEVQSEAGPEQATAIM
jgi:hypothetical protein